MNRSKLFVISNLILLALAISSLASATTISSSTATIALGDPTQMGRLGRNGVAQDWLGGEAYPGVVNTATTYHYSTYTLSNSLFDFGPGQYAGYVQIEVDSSSTNSFASAYQDSYNPASKATNWLGDPGSSGNFFGSDTLFFQVLLTQGHDLLLVFNNTVAGNVGVGDNLGIIVEAFTDTQFTDPIPTAPVPEPSSLLLLGTGVVAVGKGLRSRFRT
jgi:hypothetical protein